MNQLVNQRYEVIEKLGDSPLFAVYKARDQVQNRSVAIEVVAPPVSQDETFVREFGPALAATAGLKHPSIGQFYEAGRNRDASYAVVEYARGIDLKERIRRIAPFSLSVAIDHACTIADALHYAHSAGSTHGDLRPQNVVVSPEGAAKVTAFGVQRAVYQSAVAIDCLNPLAAFYRAPELTASLPGTPAGDIYALGIILYEMLTGVTPFAADDLETLRQQHATAPIPSPRIINPGVPRCVEGIIVKALQKQPQERYRSAAEMLNDLKSVRDALRFGKSLSWSPIDIEKASLGVSALSAPSVREELRVPQKPLEPVADVAASSRPIVAVSAQNRLRRQDESVSFILKVLIGVAAAVIFVCLIGFAGIYATRWVLPKPTPLPEMVGKSIDEVRGMAKNLKVALREHGDYMDRPKGIVYKTDPARGDQIRLGHVVNVWYSKGPVYVDVPDLRNLQREDAEQKLKDAGLAMGKVTPEYSDKVAPGAVIRQDVSSRKRVQHDTVVDIVVSDGPNPDGTGSVSVPGESDQTNSKEDAAPGAEATHTFDRSITIKNDGLGLRQVRIEFTDLDGEHLPVVDEPHKEGDKIPLHFEYRGRKITLRAFYNDEKKWEIPNLDPEATKFQRIDNPGGGR